ncbi:MAG: hypothetical protein ACFB15_05140 [Cyclobacteriaceae bacterium]
MHRICLVHLAWIILGGIIVATNVAIAQTDLKQEVEKRIKKSEMPSAALNYLSEHWLNESRKIRYYYETDGANISYEAKLIREKRRFSIEFDSSGSLQDIEELIDYEQIPASVQANIDLTLSQKYSKYRIQRVQRQFLPDTTQQNALLHFSGLTTETVDNFEIEIDTQEGSAVQSYEMLFNVEGLLVQRRTIIRRSLDNFLY